MIFNLNFDVHFQANVVPVRTLCKRSLAAMFLFWLQENVCYSLEDKVCYVGGSSSSTWMHELGQSHWVASGTVASQPVSDMGGTTVAA